MKNNILYMFFFFVNLNYSCENKNEDNNYDWQRISNDVASTSLESIYMVDEEIGYIGGNSHINVIEETYSINTGGFADSVLVTPNKYFNIFYTFEDTFHVTPILYKTKNGGKSWQSISTPFRIKVSDLYFVNKNVGYVITKSEGVYKTTDGGEHWVKVLGNLVHYYYNATYENPFKSLIFFDERNGLVYDNTGTSDIVAKTKDGGKSWDIISLSYPQNIAGKYPTIFNSLERIIFPTLSDTGFAVNNGELYRSTDEGDSWNKIYVSSSNYLNIVFTSSNVGYMPDKGLVTYDGGITWSASEKKIPLGQNMLSVNNEEFYFLYDGEIFKGILGNRASRMTLEINTLVKDLFFPSEQTGYAIGESIILKYTKKSQ